MPSRIARLRESADPPDWLDSYVASLVENHASIVVSVSRDSNRAIGYRPKCELRYKAAGRDVFDVLERYCAECGIDPRISEREETAYDRYRLTLAARDDVVAFLDPLRPYFLTDRRAMSLLLDSLIPGLEAGAHADPVEFVAWMRAVDAFRERTGRANRSKYDYDHVREEFDVDHATIESLDPDWLDHEFATPETPDERSPVIREPAE